MLKWIRKKGAKSRELLNPFFSRHLFSIQIGISELFWCVIRFNIYGCHSNDTIQRYTKYSPFHCFAIHFFCFFCSFSAIFEMYVILFSNKAFRYTHQSLVCRNILLKTCDASHMYMYMILNCSILMQFLSLIFWVFFFLVCVHLK